MTERLENDINEELTTELLSVDDIGEELATELLGADDIDEELASELLRVGELLAATLLEVCLPEEPPPQATKFNSINNATKLCIDARLKK